VFAFIPKGAGKSPWAAGTGLYLTVADGEEGAEVYALANDRNQARIVTTTRRSWWRSRRSSRRMRGAEGLDRLPPHAIGLQGPVVRVDRGAWVRPHGAIFDEFHGQPNRDLYEAIKKSMVKRRQPLMLIVTHAGDDDEGICYEEYEGAKRVLSGTVQEPTFLPVIFEAVEGRRLDDPAVWARVNPGHGITVKREGIELECLEAQNEPRKLNDFLRYHLNRWVNSAEAWIPIDWWDACDAPMPSEEELRQYPCANATDMAQKIDLAALGADPIVRYVGGADGKGGLLKRFPRLKGGEFAYDPAFATDIALALRDGFGLTTVEVRQNYQQLSEACQVFEALVKANRIIHGGHRLLRWNLENVAIKTDDAGRIRPVKPKRATKRIDGIVAAIMVISRLMLLPPEKKKKRRAPLVWTPDGFRPIGGDTPAEHSHV
jgi:phage terminase large subunit-like protein